MMHEYIAARCPSLPLPVPLPPTSSTSTSSAALTVGKARLSGDTVLCSRSSVTSHHTALVTTLEHCGHGEADRCFTRT